MYNDYWNLRVSPFQNVTDDSLIFMTPQHREGIARLYYLIDQERIAGLLTGDYGVGKTMTIEFLYRRAVKARIPTIKIDAIPNGALPMMRHILRCLKQPEKMETMAEALMTLQAYSHAHPHSLTHWLLLIDEAQHLASDDGFFMAHYICNLRIPPVGDKKERPLFTLILAGTEDLREALANRESLRRRIQLDWQLKPLSHSETCEYVQHHMRTAGGDIWSFNQESLDAVYTFSQGNPRSINNLCDTALMLGFAARASAITPRIVEQAARDTGLDRLVKIGRNNDNGGKD